MDTGFLSCYHLTLPSYLPSKNKRFDWRGRCTRFALRLLFHINHQLSTGAGSPSKPLHPTFFLSRNKYKATISHYQTLYIERIPTHEIQCQRHACANNSLLGAAMATFAIEFLLLHFTLNSSPRGRQTCRRIWLVLYLLSITFLLGAQIERKISLANKDARPKGSAALHRAE